jgi:hypothetical protein
VNIRAEDNGRARLGLNMVIKSVRRGSIHAFMHDAEKEVRPGFDPGANLDAE